MIYQEITQMLSRLSCGGSAFRMPKTDVRGARRLDLLHALCVGGCHRLARYCIVILKWKVTCRMRKTGHPTFVEILPLLHSAFHAAPYLSIVQSVSCQILLKVSQLY